MADLIIGQPDRFSTVPYGPGTTFSTGLYYPTGLAVYKSDLYVVDSGNNRVLRYPNPFSPVGQAPPNLYIGQPSLSSRAPDQPNGQVSALGIYTAAGTSAPFVANIAFDSTGNLWMTDPGNRRVLRFPAAAIAKGGGGLAADIEIGQVDFVSTQKNLDPVNANSPTYKNQFAVPAGIAFDAAGNLYVSDADLSTTTTTIPGRVLVFTPPFLPTSSIYAARIMGVFQQSATAVPQSQVDHTVMINPQGIFMLPNSQGRLAIPAVVDTQSSRILIFDQYTLWPDENTSFSPPATTIIGQANSCVAYPARACRAPNNGTPSPSAGTLAYPSSAALAGTDLLIADAGNNRAIGVPQQAGAYVSANRVLGQDRFDTFSINLIEGREFAFYIPGNCADAALAVDSTGDTPHLYVADPCNNRVLGFKDARKLTPGTKADIVIGQPDMQTALCNSPSGDPNQPTKSNLCGPVGLLVDSGGNLYVADSGNGRVLRFPTPFAHQGLPAADRVVGQANFTTKVTDPSTTTMAAPYGLALSGLNGLLVSDVLHNRVLYFPMANGDLTSPQGETATKVFGQPNFTSIVKGSATDDTSMTSPHHLAADSFGRLYVVDTGNNRVLVFGDPHDPSTASTDAHAVLIISGLNVPRGIYVSPATGEIWVANTGISTCLRYPSFEQYFVSGTYNLSIPGSYGAPLALAQDQYGDLLVADASNRVEFYYPGLDYQNAASYIREFLAPGAIATIYPLDAVHNPFSTDTANSNQQPNPVPYATLLADTQVLFNGQPAPLLLVSPGQINFMIPMSAPTSGTADVQVVRQSTGQILADWLLPMNSVSPAIFGANTSCIRAGKCPAAVVNAADGTNNSPANPAAAGSYISIYATGQGFVQGAPPVDGDIPRGGLVSTSTMPKVWINACYVDDANCTHETGVDTVQFSGLSPQFPGVWQINVRIPKSTGPGAQIPIFIVMNSATSQSAATGYITTIAVKNQ
jgi:uncharacterized protein (TIGR03437 family)